MTTACKDHQRSDTGNSGLKLGAMARQTPADFIIRMSMRYILTMELNKP